MSFDGTVTKALIYELNRDYTGGKIDRIFQTEKDELLLQLRCGPNRGNLVLSASANNPRAYITQEKKKNPQSPPAFCMLLRKHLESSTIKGFEQVEMDRIIKIHLLGTDELFDVVNKTLIIEIMGRHSNIILVNDEDQVIIDSIKRINQSISRVRQILPGLTYSNKEIINKDNPLLETKEHFIKKINNTDENKIKDFLIKTYMGLSPLIAREIIFRADLGETLIGNLQHTQINDLYTSFSSLMEIINNNQFVPNQIVDKEKTIAFSSISLKQYPSKDSIVYDSIHELLDQVFYTKDNNERIQQKSQNINRLVKNQLEKTLKKQEKLELELREAKNRNLYKIYGDVLSANSWAVKRGDSEAILENFYDNMNEIVIPLDIRKDAIQNAAHFYKKYSKLKHAQTTIQAQLKKTRWDIQYLDSLLYSIESCQSVDEIDEIQEEFKVDYLKKKISNKKKLKNNKKKGFLTYETQNGDLIFVGRNNRENSELTLKFAHNKDMWFHVKYGPGSHIILRTNKSEYSTESILAAANLASLFSRQKNSSNVEVDYTEKKYVKRHPQNQPGLVTYTDFKTLFITPDQEKLKALSKK